MVLMVIWYFEIFRVEDLVQLTWVPHFIVVQLRALFILIMTIIKVISSLSSLVFLIHHSYFCFVESGFGLESLFIVHVESSVDCSPLFFTHDVLISSFSDMIILL